LTDGKYNPFARRREYGVGNKFTKVLATNKSLRQVSFRGIYLQVESGFSIGPLLEYNSTLTHLDLGNGEDLLPEELIVIFDGLSKN
jgi:hypothetical protein